MGSRGVVITGQARMDLKYPAFHMLHRFQPISFPPRFSAKQRSSGRSASGAPLNATHYNFFRDYEPNTGRLGTNWG